MKSSDEFYGFIGIEGNGGVVQLKQNSAKDFPKVDFSSYNKDV